MYINMNNIRKYIDVQLLKKLVDEGKSYKEISEIMHCNETSLCRCYTKNFGARNDRAASYRQKLDISDEQKQIIFGSLLGDMCLAPHVKTIRGSECHSDKQKEYAKYKYSLLKGLVGKMLLVTTTLSGKDYNKRLFSIRPNINLWPLYELFYYDNKKKDVPFDLSLLTPRAIAFWFMDDGYIAKTQTGANLGFSTCSFSFDGLYRLQSYLKTKYGIETIVRKNKYLVVRTKSCKKLSEMIKPYMIPSMYYKLGKYL